MANDSIRGRQVVLRLTNKSGGGLVEGDVVIISSGTAAAITTTTSAGQTDDMVGVVLETIASDAIGRVCIMGYVPKINLSGAASLGDTFATHSVAKQASPAASRSSGHFGEVLGTGTTPSALLWGFPDSSAAAGMSGDALWDAAGDLAIGTGANTGGKLAIGTYPQILRVNAGATAPEWVSAGRVLISEQTPTGTGTVTWSSIPAIYNSLEIEMVARSDKAATVVESAYLWFNNDTTAANYRQVYEEIRQTTVAANAGDQSFAFQVAAATAPANSCTVGFVKVINYASTTFFKYYKSWDVVRRDNTTNHVYRHDWNTEWENTGAINRIDIILDSGGNYIAGTKFRLYGVF